jgi:hypothetical protein
VLWRRRYPLSRWAAVAILSYALAPALAFDDREFCLAAQQIVIAAEKDVGLWIDRVTRNAGMAVSCERKLVKFERFTYAPSASMTEAWRERSAAEWNATHCNSPIWGDAIRNGWKIVLVVTSADGRQVTLSTQCG